MSKILGVLTSGGDCAGLNAVIRAVTYRAVRHHGWKVLGIHDGTLGLMEAPPRYRELTPAFFSGDELRESGTFLGTTNKGDPFRFPMPDGSVRDRSEDFARGARELGLDALVVIGGDGSMRILSRLCERAGLAMAGVPKTIDNDVHGTEFAVGFATAVQVATEALDRLQPTAQSHHRVMVLEVMGRDTGHIALTAGIAGGADVILVPEIPFDLKDAAGHIGSVFRERCHALVVVAEGVRVSAQARQRAGAGAAVAEQLAALTGAETRVTVLGHVQRGGTPMPQDRWLGSALGLHAVDLIAQGHTATMVGWQNGRVVEVPLSQVTVGARALDPQGALVQTARGLGIYIGAKTPAG